MSGPRKLVMVPMGVQRGRNDLVCHVLRHYVCAPHPFDFGTRPPFSCPELVALCDAIEAATPRAAELLQAVRSACAAEAKARGSGRKRTQPKAAQLIQSNPQWWDGALFDAVYAAHQKGYAPRYFGLVRSLPLPGEPGACWFRSPKLVGRHAGRRRASTTREIKSMPLKRFERQPGTLRTGIYVVHGRWNGFEDRLELKSAYVDEGALARNAAYASNGAARRKAAGEARKAIGKIGPALSARGGRRRLSERERQKLLKLR